MIGTTVKEEFNRYDFIVLFRGDAQPNDIFTCFSYFVEDKNSFFLKNGFYSGKTQLSYPIRKNTSAHFYSLDLFALPTKIIKISQYFDKSDLAIRSLIVKNEDDQEKFTPFKIKEKDDENNQYKDIIKNLIQ